MVSSSTVPDMGAFSQPKISRGNITVPPDHLSISSNSSPDEFSDTKSFQSEYLNGMTSPTPFSLSILPSPITSQNDVSRWGADFLQPIYPDRSITSLDSLSVINEIEPWPIDPELFVSPPADYQLQGDFSKTAFMPVFIDSEPLAGRAPMPAPPTQPMPSQSSKRGNSPASQFDSVNEQPIPSYMSPEAIRARNLILRCNLPSQRKKIKPAHTRDPTRHVQFPEDSQSSKRQKLDGSCCPYSRVNGVRPR